MYIYSISVCQFTLKSNNNQSSGPFIRILLLFKKNPTNYWSDVSFTRILNMKKLCKCDNDYSNYHVKYS